MGSAPVDNVFFVLSAARQCNMITSPWIYVLLIWAGLPVCTWRDMECTLFLALILLRTCLWWADRTGECLFCIVYFIHPPPFCGHPSRLCQSLNILCACRDARVIRVSLSCGWPQTATAETVEIHTLGVQYMAGGHIAWYVPSELYIEADHTTVVWPLFKKKPPNSQPNALPLKRHQAGSICHLNVWLSLLEYIMAWCMDAEDKDVFVVRLVMQSSSLRWRITLSKFLPEHLF